MKEKLRLAVFGHKRWSREGGVEIVVKELCTRMAQQGCQVTCYNRSGHHVSGAEYDDAGKTEYEGIRQKSVPTIERIIWVTRKILISCGFARRDLFLPQLVSVCHGALRSGVISGINGFWLRSILNPPQRKLISRNSIRSASWYALCAELCLMSLLILEAIPKLIRCKGTDGILG